MALQKDEKQKIIDKFKTHKNDTGSPEVQIAILTAEIQKLVDHLKEHKHDYSSRKGLIKMVNERRSLMRYLKRESIARFEKLIKAVNSHFKGVKLKS